METNGWSYGVTLPWQPHAKMRPRISRGGARTHQDPKDRAAEDHTRDYLEEVIAERSLPVLTGNVSLSAVFYRASRQVVDLDNLLKHLMDCLNGLAFVDDSQVTRYQEVRLELDRDQPRTEFEVRDDWSTMTRGTDAPK
jgi:Holliday junction resolvase RusA-like endonuclease